MDTRMSVFAICASKNQLDRIADTLMLSGVPARRMLVILPEKQVNETGLAMLRPGAVMPDPVPKLDGLLTWLMKFGAIVITGVGLLVAGNTFSHIILGGEGPTERGPELLEALGLSILAADEYDARVQDGGIFLFVDCQEPEEVREICSIFHSEHAEHINALGALCFDLGLEELTLSRNL
jgi:hypothetical protein